MLAYTDLAIPMFAKRFALIAVVLALSLAGHGQTLDDLLKSAGIPSTEFLKAETDHAINGSSKRKGDVIYAVYMLLDGELITGDPHLLRFDTNTHKLLRSDLHLEGKDKESCCGSPLGIQILTSVIAFSFHSSPSSNAVLVADQNLNLVEIFYGFGIEEVAPDQIVFTESMVHFAPAHPERLQFLDLRSGAAQEIYPPKGDKLRAQFAEQNDKLMTNDKNCRALPGTCDPESYDESLRVIRADQPGTFALATALTAFSIDKDGQPADSINDQSALYFYRWERNRWLYCQREVSDEEAKGFASQLAVDFNSLKRACTPDIPAEPDPANPRLGGPFPAPSHRRN